MKGNKATRCAFLSIAGIAFGHLTFGLVTRIQPNSLGVVETVEVVPGHTLGDTVSTVSPSNSDGLWTSPLHPSNAPAAEICPKGRSREQRDWITDSDNILPTVPHAEYLYHCQTALSSKERHPHGSAWAAGPSGFDEEWNHLVDIPQFVHHMERQRSANSVEAGSLLIYNERSQIPESSLVFPSPGDGFFGCGLMESAVGPFEGYPAVSQSKMINNEYWAELYSYPDRSCQADGSLGTDASRDKMMLTGASPPRPHLNCRSSLLSDESEQLHAPVPKALWEQEPSSSKRKFASQTKEHFHSTVDWLNQEQTQPKELEKSKKAGTSKASESTASHIEPPLHHSEDSLPEEIENINHGIQQQATYPEHITAYEEPQLHQESSLRMVILKSDWKLLAWIGSMSFGTLESEIILLENLKCEILFDFRKSESCKSQFIFANVLNTMMHNQHSFNAVGVLGDLMDKIWYINGKFLEQFGLKHSEPLFNMEQTQLMKWIGYFFRTSRKDMRVALFTIPGLEGTEGEISWLLQEFVGALLYYEDDGCVWAVESNRSKVVLEYSSHEIALTKLAVFLMGTYYKSENYPKWKALFQSDPYFIILLAKIKFHHYCQKYKRPEMISDEDSNPLVPWKNEWSQSYHLGAGHKYPMGSMDHYIELGNQCVVIYQKEDRSHDSIRSHSLRNENPHVYQFLSSMQQKRYKWKSIALHKSCSRISDILKPLIPDDRSKNIVINFFKQISQKSWIINHKLLETLGAEFKTDLFDYEQICLQNWILGRALFYTKRIFIRDLKFDSAETSARMCESKELDGIIRELCNKETGMETRDNLPEAEILGKSQEDYDTLIIKEVVDMLYSYYKKTNPKKWNSIFIQDSRFLKLLVDIQVHVSNQNFPRRKKHIQNYLKDHNLLPWNSDCLYDSFKYQKMVREFFGPMFSKHYILESSMKSQDKIGKYHFSEVSNHQMDKQSSTDLRKGSRKKILKKSFMKTQDPEE